MKKNATIIFKYSIEFLIVGFGVFLGIYASEIQNNNIIKKEKEKSIEYIIEELENNKKNLEQSFKYHQLIKSKIDSIYKVLNETDLSTIYIGNDKFRHDNINGWNGVSMANLDDTAFETAKISGIIKEFDFKIIQNISKVYKSQNAYVEFGNSVLNKMINFNSSTKVSDVVGSIELMAYDLSAYEESLLNVIEKVQSEIKAPNNNSYK